MCIFFVFGGVIYATPLLLSACVAFIRGTIEVHPEWTPTMYQWMCTATLVFRTNTPEAQHVTPADVIVRTSNGTKEHLMVLANCNNTIIASR